MTRASGLLDQHQPLLEASAINAGIARSRGYFSVANATALEQLGFSPAQQRTPALVIPLWNVHGQVAFHQARPDLPRHPRRQADQVRDAERRARRCSTCTRSRGRTSATRRGRCRHRGRAQGRRRASRRASTRSRCSASGTGAARTAPAARRRCPTGRQSRSTAAPSTSSSTPTRTTKPQVRVALRRLGRFLESRGADRADRPAAARPRRRQAGPRRLHRRRRRPATSCSPRAPTLAEETSDLLGYQYTDLGNAHRFVAMHAGRFRHCREERRWLEWRDGRWRRDVTGAAERAAAEVVEALWAQVRAAAGRQAQGRRVTGRCAASRTTRSARCSALASSDAEIVVRLDQLDADPYLLSLRQRHARPPHRRAARARPGRPDHARHRRRLRARRAARALAALPRRGVRRRPRADRVREARLRLVRHRRHARPRAVHRVRARASTARSTLNRAVQHVLGDFAHTAPIRVVMRTPRRRRSRTRSPRSHASGSSSIAETADGQRLDENRVKMLTGRDKVPARFLHREWFEFEPEYKLVLYHELPAEGRRLRRRRLGSHPADPVPRLVRRPRGQGARREARRRSRGHPRLARRGLPRVAGRRARHLRRRRAGNRRLPHRERRRSAASSTSAASSATTTASSARRCATRSSRLLRRRATTTCRRPRTLGRWLTERGVAEARLDGDRAYRGIRLCEEKP